MTGRKELLNQIQSEIGKAVSGKEEIVKKIFTAVLAGGHVLLEDVPGVGKNNACHCIFKGIKSFIQKNAVYTGCLAGGCYWIFNV